MSTSISTNGKKNQRIVALSAAIPSLANRAKFASLPTGSKQADGKKTSPSKQASSGSSDGTKPGTTTGRTRVIDIGVNLAHKTFLENWEEVVQRSINAGVDTLMLTGTSLKSSGALLEMAKEWFEKTGTPNLWVTVGVHPHEAKRWDKQGGYSVAKMKELLQHPFAVAVGEIGLDYARNFSEPSVQRRAFRRQLELAVELGLPVFAHEREAHSDFNTIVDQVHDSMCTNGKKMPSIVVHCFTGTENEAFQYIQRGYFLGFSGIICKHERGASLRELLPHLPVHKLMVETDAPFMGWKMESRNKENGMLSSEPADCMAVAIRIGKVMGMKKKRICDLTTRTAATFFRLAEMEAALVTMPNGKLARKVIYRNGKTALVPFKSTN